MDALYFRVSSERQTTENQFEDLLKVAEKDGSGRDWHQIRQALSTCIVEEHHPTRNGGTRTVYKVRPDVAAELARHSVYVEQGKSSRTGPRRRPLFDQMKRDAAARRFDRLLVWKVSRLGRDMREVISTVYELTDLGVTVVPIKSQTGPISSTMGKLLWAIQAWYAEMENSEKSEAIKAGQARARAGGRPIGRPRVVFRRDHALQLHGEGLSGREIARRLGIGEGTVRRALNDPNRPSGARQNPLTEALRAALDLKGLPAITKLRQKESFGAPRIQALAPGGTPLIHAWRSLCRTLIRSPKTMCGIMPSRIIE